MQRVESRVTARRIGWMALALALVTAGLITYGSWVRVSAAGLGCPDWPLCDGGLLPGGTRASAIEYGHRILAGVTMVLVAAVGVLAFRRRREVLGSWALLALAAVLIFVQAGLGGITVLADLPGWVRLAHLAMGMIIVALLAAGGLAVLARQWAPSPSPLHAFPLVLTAAGIIMVGGSIVATHTSFGCLDLPVCDGGASTMATWLHTLHRSLGLVLFAGVVFMAVEMRRRGGTRPMAVALGSLALFLVVQMSVGAASIAVEMPDGLRVLHVALASLTWLSLIALWVLSTAPNRGAAQGPPLP